MYWLPETHNAVFSESGHKATAAAATTIHMCDDQPHTDTAVTIHYK